MQINGAVRISSWLFLKLQINRDRVSEYCREKGVYPEQVKEWKEACINANDNAKGKRHIGRQRTSVQNVKKRKS